MEPGLQEPVLRFSVFRQEEQRGRWIESVLYWLLIREFASVKSLNLVKVSAPGLQQHLEFSSNLQFIECEIRKLNMTQARSQPVFSGKPEEPFCLSCTFIFPSERNWMKKSVRVSEKTGKPGLTWLTGSYAPVTNFQRISKKLIDCCFLAHSATQSNLRMNFK